ncbi:ABC-type branched-subunit amino acid transport system substrate-binding protein [Amycolatopsis sulphurea]|uniref:ABC-type branched-subunit amino acid transport system substrate-binding protein n=1 Tax=Amycolatopsis sulphurea TaxID=76022 RepID=A0A2A9FEM4_9PSEU|nr:ABC transporter substrate-binding protein [Amycolatopsis sulphurea]PFG48875.1 ABC-type branched-subunit amino acid transport system substrate-binding protein [Amycolatopsis sulphurea]
MTSERIRPPRPSWIKWLWGGGVIVLLAVVLVAVFVVVPAISDASHSCGDGVRERGDNSECTGVTDGSFVFADDLADVQQRIHQENTTVTGSGKPYVNIAVLLPMTLVEPDQVSREWVRHQLEGAYIAQHRANTTESWGAKDPQIRLLLANPGSQLKQWEPVVDDLIGRSGPDQVIAVTGIGLSLSTSQQAVQRLSDHQIPVVASHLAAEEFSRIPGFMRVSPTSSTYGTALAAFVKPTARTATLVQDQNPRDLYPKTLASAFTAKFVDGTHRLAGRTEYFDSNQTGVENTFLQMMPNICSDHPDVLYFAGREQNLTSFIAQLAQRRCLDQHLTVLTGDLAQTGPPGPDMRRGLEANVTVLGPGLAHPQAWTSHPELFNKPSVASFQEPRCTDCFEVLFPQERLDDGTAILAHDAVVTVVWAIRGLPQISTGTAVTSQDVLQAKNRLHDQLAVPGASGAISFDEQGNPVNKVIPILRVRVNSTPEFAALSDPSS